MYNLPVHSISVHTHSAVDRACPVPPQSTGDTLSVQPDDLILFLQLAGQKDEVGENKYDLSLLTATGASGSGGTAGSKEDKLKSQLNKVCRCRSMVGR